MLETTLSFLVRRTSFPIRGSSPWNQWNLAKLSPRSPRSLVQRRSWLTMKTEEFQIRWFLWFSPVDNLWLAYVSR